jgi:hypothetical protein
MTSPTSPFLAPSDGEETRPARPASDCGEAAMDRLRHPFSVGPAPELPAPRSPGRSGS